MVYSLHVASYTRSRCHSRYESVDFAGGGSELSLLIAAVEGFAFAAKAAVEAAESTGSGRGCATWQIDLRIFFFK